MENPRKRLTAEQWQAVEKLATSLYTHASLLVDGYRLDLQLVPDGPYKNIIFVYMDGKIDWGKLTKDCDERRRFCRPVTKYLLPAKPPKSWKPKEWQRRRRETAFTAYYPWWTSFDPLKRHLVKNNHDIEIVEKED